MIALKRVGFAGQAKRQEEKCKGVLSREPTCQVGVAYTRWEVATEAGTSGLRLVSAQIRALWRCVESRYAVM